MFGNKNKKNTTPAEDTEKSEDRTLKPLKLSETNQEFLERCRYTPVRLTPDERQMLIVLQNSLNVSEYTDEVDCYSRHSKSDRILTEVSNMLSLISGLSLAGDLRLGQEMINRTMTDNISTYARYFEIGRRYKIMNPDKMRSSYGKLMFMLQDCQSRIIQGNSSAGGLNFVSEIEMVSDYCKRLGISDLLMHDGLRLATMSLDDPTTGTDGDTMKDGNGLSMAEIKKRAADDIISTFSSSSSPQAIQLILDSISDSSSFLSYAVKPVEDMISLLTSNYTHQGPINDFSLELSPCYRRSSSSSSSWRSIYSYGNSNSTSDDDTDNDNNNTAKLTHSHSTQFIFVLQSLLLWREVMRSLYKLYHLADLDLLSSSSSYYLANTGQGLNRMQSCHSVGSEMSSILSRVRSQVGSWIGLSVVHLGDRDVPNALVFIDKYTQVPRILKPIVQVLSSLDSISARERQFIDEEWGGVVQLKLVILTDFFKHGFDGSGDDGGSCIDGRLTSAWNWCSRIAKKPWYHVFMMTGFQGFDGDWKE